jgi:hypothetical protein
VKEKMFVTHGRVTHEVGDECKVCEEAERVFLRDLKNGEVERLIGRIDPKIKKELLSKNDTQTIPS